MSDSMDAHTHESGDEAHEASDNDNDSVFDMGGQPPCATLQLRDWQHKASEELCAQGRAKRGSILHGGVGSGKTITSLHALECLGADPCENDEPFCVLGIVPNCVLHQWPAECTDKAGIDPERVLLYHGRPEKRRKDFDLWIERAERSVGAGVLSKPVYLFTTYETVLSELKNKKMKVKRLERAWAYVLFDEAHGLRNGVEKSSSEEIVLSTKFYKLFDQHVMRAFTPRVMMLTATPVINSPLDAFSLARWLNMPLAMLNKTTWAKRQSTSSSEFMRSTVYFMENHMVNVASDPVPPPTIEVVKLKRSLRERALCVSAYDLLYFRATELLRAAGKHTNSGGSQQTLVELKRKKQAFLAQVTRCRRGEVDPNKFVQDENTFQERLALALEDEEPEAGDDDCDDEEDDGEQETGNEEKMSVHSTETADTGGTEDANAKNATPMETDLANAPNRFPLADCTKIAHAIEWCRERRRRGEPGLILGYFVEPLRALVTYLKEDNELSKQPVFEHYGGQGALNRRLLATHAGLDASEGGIVVASRGSLGQGVNLPHIRHLYFVDRDWSGSLEDQAIGRIIRPLVQSVHEWHVTYTEFDDAPGTNDPSHKNAGLTKRGAFSVEQWMKVVQVCKRNMVADLFASRKRSQVASEEAKDASAVVVASGEHGSKAREGVQRSIAILMQMIEAAALDETMEAAGARQKRLEDGKKLKAAFAAKSERAPSVANPFLPKPKRKAGPPTHYAKSKVAKKN